MNPVIAQVQALAMQIECLRAQVNALVDTLAQQQAAEAPAPVATVETCACGASGETQQAVRFMGGQTAVFCQACKQKRVIDPST